MGPLAPLSYEWLGALALGILWVNALLIAAAAMHQRAALGALRRSLVDARRDGTLIAGVVEHGRGPDGSLAVRRVEQMGRAMTVPGPDRILFTERSARGELFGGMVRTDAGEVIELEPRADGVETWLAEDAPARRTEGEFDVAWSRASTNKGFVSTLEQSVVAGARVWVCSTPDAVLVATIDPIADCARKRSLLATFAVGVVISCGVVSVVACWPPVFGTVSTVGGVLGVAYFLGVQPLGTMVRDAALPARDRRIGGIWQRPLS